MVKNGIFNNPWDTLKPLKWHFLDIYDSILVLYDLEKSKTTDKKILNLIWKKLKKIQFLGQNRHFQRSVGYPKIHPIEKKICMCSFHGVEQTCWNFQLSSSKKCYYGTPYSNGSPHCLAQNIKHLAAIMQVLEQFEFFRDQSLSLDPVW